jgi:hypothetical protein
MAKKKRPSLIQLMQMQRGQQSPRTKAGAKWLSKIKKGSVAPKGSHALLFKTNKIRFRFFFFISNFKFLNFVYFFL